MEVDLGLPQPPPYGGPYYQQPAESPMPNVSSFVSPSFQSFQKFAMGSAPGLEPSAPLGSAKVPHGVLPPSQLGGGNYAPLSGQSSVAESSRVKSATLVLAMLSMTYSSVDIFWPQHFWQIIQLYMDHAMLDAVVMSLLQKFGYSGAECTTTPRMPDFKSVLERIATMAPAQGDSAGFGPLADVGSLAQVSANRWTTQLPIDFKRSALEIFRNVRSMGCVTVRDWVSQNYSGQRNSDIWVDLWTIATMLDYRIADAAVHGDQGAVNLLNSDDAIELAFRRLASYIHVERTGDTNARLRMLGQAAPGMKADIASSWLVDECATASKQEHQRNERVKPNRWKKKGNKGDGKNAKGDKGGKSGGGAAGL